MMSSFKRARELLKEWEARGVLVNVGEGAFGERRIPNITVFLEDLARALDDVQERNQQAITEGGTGDVRD
jgi:hypothetical protein